MGEEATQDKIPTKEELLEAIDKDKEEETTEEGEQELTETEQEAMTRGWKPEGVEGKRTLTAEEFLDRQPLYDEIHSLKRQTRKMQEGIDALQKHQQFIRKQEREKTIQELKQAKVTALEEGDHAKVVEIDDRIQDTKAEEVNEAPPPNTDFEDWVDKNTWYNQNPEMKAYADMVGAGYAQLNNGVPLEEIYEHVTKEVKARFPSNFAGNRRGKPNPVEGAGKGRSGPSKAKHTVKDLPDEERQMMRTILRVTPGMTEQQYLDDYFKYE